MDSLPPLVLSSELEAYITRAARHIGTEQISQMIEASSAAAENPEEFFSGKQEALRQYLAYRQTGEYKNSPAHKLMQLLKQFNNATGYYTIFIPAMQALSPLYAAYHKQLLKANKVLPAHCPEALQALS
ncbi:MAG: hypothetical protein ACK5L3_14640 [Oscillospiraceae bacterium]